MGDGNYLGELLAARREAPTPGIVTGMQQGLGLGQDIKAIPYNNALMNYGTQEIQRKQQEQTALKQAMQTGDVKALMGINPQMAREVGKVQDWYKTQSDPVQKDIGRLTESLPTIAPMLNSKSWGALRPQLLKNYPNVPESALPPPNATDQQLDMWANHAAFLAAQLKQMTEAPKVQGGYLLQAGQPPQELPPTAVGRSTIAKNLASVGLSQARIDQGWGKLAIDKDKENQTGPYAQLTRFYEQLRPGQEPTESDLKTLHDEFGKSGLDLGAKTDITLAKQALTNLNKNEGKVNDKGQAYKDLNPDDPLREKLLDQEIARLRPRFGGGVPGAGNPPPKKPLSELSDAELQALIDGKQAGQ